MTKKSFLAGLFLSPITGIPIAMYYDIIGVVVGVAVGSFIASSKKGGAFIGLVTSPIIYLSTYYLSLIIKLVQNTISVFNFTILAGFALIDLYVLLVMIGGLALGILFGWLGLKYSE